MKLEIDIDEDYYKIICKRVEDNKPYHSPYEYEVIADGKALEQEPVIDKICADIQRLRGCSCSCSDGIIDDVEDILDKYRADKEQE